LLNQQLPIPFSDRRAVQKSGGLTQIETLPQYTEAFDLTESVYTK